MKQPIRILLQTTIPTTPDDWSIDRFSLLERYLSSLEDGAGQISLQIVARVGVASSNTKSASHTLLSRSKIQTALTRTLRILPSPGLLAPLCLVSPTRMVTTRC